MAVVTICSDFGAQKNKVCHYFHCFSIYLPWSDGTGYHDLCFPNVEFKPSFSLSSFTFIKRLFSSSSLSAIRVVSSASLRLIFLLAILIPACASSSPAFLMMYSAYNLNKQGDNIQPSHSPFPIWKLSFHVQFYLLLPDLHTGFSRGRSGGLVFPSLSEFSTDYCDPQSEGFGIVNKAEIDVFLEVSCFFNDLADVGNLISASSAFCKDSLNICSI